MAVLPFTAPIRALRFRLPRIAKASPHFAANCKIDDVDDDAVKMSTARSCATTSPHWLTPDPLH